MNTKELKMTEGNIPKLLIRFAIPLLLGNIFQQLYNMVDTWVLGNFVSNEAFSAVGTVSPFINMLIGFFIGLSSGAGVLVAQYFGANQPEQAQKVTHTAIVLTAILDVLLTFGGLALIPTMLNLMNVPDSVRGDATTYLSIFLSGITGMLFYNMGAALLQAVGDSRHPFYYLSTAAVMNIVLDLVFVLRFGMAVDGVAYATILSQLVSAVLTIHRLFHSGEYVRIHLRKLRIDPIPLKNIFRIGLPSALQMALISFSNIFVQAYINYFGPNVMSGWTAYLKIDALMLLPAQSIALSTTTFVGQNIGVGDEARAREGVRHAQRLAILFTLIPMIPVMIFAGPLVGFFNPEPAVIEAGTLILRWLSPFYILATAAMIYASALRGAGNSKAPMIIMIFSYVVFRQIYLYIVAHFISNTMIPIALGYPLGWVLCSLLISIYFRRTDLTAKSVHMME